MLIESVAPEAFRSNTLERLDVTLTSTPLDRSLPGSLPFTPPPSSLPNSLAHTADDLVMSSTAATPGKKKHPRVNVPRWSPLYRKLQQRSDKPLDNLSVDVLTPARTALGSLRPSLSLC
jgi:hypothetical protein